MRDLGRFVIRAASEAGASEVLEFYADNAHENNAQRGDDVMLQAIRDRKLFVVEDPSGRIVGAAAVFGHEVGGKLFLEAGASRVPRLGGFKPLSFHQILHRVRSVHAHVWEDAIAAYFGTVALHNARSIDNLKEAGFSEWNPPDERLKEKKERIAARFNRVREVDYYRLAPERVRDHARELIEWAGGIELTRRNRDDGEEERVRVELKFGALTRFIGLLVDPGAD